MKLITNILIWIFAVLLTVTVLYYQRMTGPTYPQRGSVEIGNQEIDYKLLRTWANEKEVDDRLGARISITAEDPEISGECKYKRLGTADEWTILKMQREGNDLVAMLPSQPPAGKLLYLVSLQKSNESYSLTENPVVIRFKGWIPAAIPPPPRISDIRGLTIFNYDCCGSTQERKACEGLYGCDTCCHVRWRADHGPHHAKICLWRILDWLAHRTGPHRQ